jgi:hypothetical protein
MEISLRASERILNLLSTLKDENTDKRRKDLKLSELDYEKMIDEWNSFRKYDPALHRLQFAILILLQFKPNYFYSHFANFSGWLKGYRNSYFSVTGHVPRKDLPEMKPDVRLINLADSPLKYFAKSDIWETSFQEYYGYHLLNDTSEYSLDYIEFIIL